MTLFLLDTDTLTLLQHGHPVIAAAVASHTGDRIGVTSVSVEEQVSGRLAVIRKAKTPADQARAAEALAFTVTFLGRFPILPLTEPAVKRFEELLKQKRNVRGMDLRIAAIALELGATVITRNLRDFSRVPGIVLADWSGGTQPVVPT